MFLANLSQREKMLFYLTLGAICISLIYNFPLKAVWANWQELNRQIVNKEIELRRNIEYIEQTDQMEEIYQNYVGYVQRRGSDEEEMASLLNEVESQARAAQIRIVNIKPKPIKDLSLCKKYILAMNCEAAMEQYIDFIYNLQRSAQLIRVEKLKLTSQSKGKPALKAQIFVSKMLTSP